ncbi:MAG: phosphate butyryltransferase [Muribaculaceae bacterium]|nr:phosphate butyryltransferase [Muribaculaceae bacterium]
MITRLEELVIEARRKGASRLAVACAADAHTLEAVAAAASEGIVEPILFGDGKLIAEICAAEGIDAASWTVVDVNNTRKAVAEAVRAVSEGRADVLMKGLVSTDVYMRGILDKECGLLPPKGTLSHVSVIELPGREKLLTVADVAVIPAPDFRQKCTLIGYLAATARVLGVERPKIACIAPSEQVLPTVPSSTEAAIIAKMADRGQLGDVTVDGPLSLDVALWKEAAEVKKVKGSSVAGDADCLLFPNIESGNVFFKSATHLAGADIAAIVTGTAAPCVLTSRGDTPRTKLFSIALACLAKK